MKLDAIKYGYELAINDVMDILSERTYKIYGTKGGSDKWHELERVWNMIRSRHNERQRDWKALEELTNDD